jgi:predicted permease
MTNGFLAHLAQSFTITAPILVVLALGIVFRQKNWVDAHFVEVGNRLLYYVCMPSLLFLATAAKPLSRNEDLPLALFGVAATFVVVLLLWLLAPLFTDRDMRGAFVQSSFRSNMGMIGIALCLNAYGEDVLGRAGIFVAAMIVAYNVLSIMVLTSHRSQVMKNLARNPLLIGILAGIAWQQSGLGLPVIMEGSVGYLARMALPLALICIGASLEWRKLRPDHPDVIWASAFKMLIIPTGITTAAVLAGFRGEDLGILFLMVASPTAMVAFVMAREFAPRSEMTAEVIALTTLVMPVTVTIGLTVLSTLGLL